MKIQVVRTSCEVETLTLTEPLTMIRSVTDGGMNRIVTATGMEHWFNDDGTYDGWGMDVSGSGIEVPDTGNPIEAVSGFIEAIEADREFPNKDKESHD